MIKEIAEEFDRQNRINVLNLLKQIKDFSYSINGTFRNVLQYENKEEDIKISLDFAGKHISEINISKINKSSWADGRIVHIKTGLNSKGVVKIAEELHTKYFGGK